MKKLTFIMIALCFGLFNTAFAQDTLASWTFPTGTDLDSLADGGIYANNCSIHSFGGTDQVTFSKNGFTTKAAQATGWDNGANTKGWEISVTATGYRDIQLMSKQTSGGSNPGPRNFNLQYSLDNVNWTNVTDSLINVQNDWTSGVISIGLPLDCNDETLINIRWLMSNDTASDGSLVAASGTSKIDDIYILATKYNSSDERFAIIESHVYPNPVNNILQVRNIKELTLYNSSGQILKTYIFNQNQSIINTSDLTPGVYFARMLNFKNELNSMTILKR